MQPGDKGIDVSRWQHPNGAPIDYQAVKDSGISFVYLELTSGTYASNPYCVTDARGFQAVGIATGAYQFLSPTDTFDEQVSDFTKLYSAIGGWTLPVMIDNETESAQGWATLAKLVGDMRTNLIGSTGAQVGMYVNLNFYDNLPGCPWGWPIWLADPSHATPSKPCLLQQVGQGSVPGIEGSVDLDVWSGPGAIANPGAPGTPVATKPKKGPSVYLTVQDNEQWLCTGSTALHVLDNADLQAYLSAGVVTIPISPAQFALYTQVG